MIIGEREHCIITSYILYLWNMMAAVIVLALFVRLGQNSMSFLT